MKPQNTRTHTHFICRSLLWSLLFYGCFMGVTHWHEITGLFGNKHEQPMVHTTSSDGNMVSFHIPLDSMQKGIRIADGLLQRLSVILNR